MKKMILSALAIASPVQGSPFAASLEERVEELEFSRDLNIFSFDGELENRVDTYSSKDNKNRGANENTDKTLWSTYFKLNIASKPNDKLSFYGRLTM